MLFSSHLPEHYSIGCVESSVDLLTFVTYSYFLGLDVDGIYRVSGNLSHVQKLRYLIDRGE